MPTQIALPGPAARSWLARNTYWVVTAAVAGAGVFAAGVLFIVLVTFKGSDAYRDAVAQARANPDVIRELGEPIETGWWVTGSIKINGPSGEADFETPISGPAATGTLYVTAERRAGRWVFQILEVAISGKAERINVLNHRPGV